MMEKPVTAEKVLALRDETGVSLSEAKDILVDQAAKDAAHLTREFLKKSLTERGIQFKASAKTETLQKLLDGAEKVGIPKVEDEQKTEPAEAPKVEEAPRATVAPGAVTKDATRDALVALSALKGKDEALSVLKVLGKAEKLSDVDPSRYMLIVDACKVRGVTVNA